MIYVYQIIILYKAFCVTVSTNFDTYIWGLEIEIFHVVAWILQNHFCWYSLNFDVCIFTSQCNLKKLMLYKLLNSELYSHPKQNPDQKLFGSFSDISLSFTKAGVCASFASLDVQHVFYIQQCLFFSPGICYS